jgi:oligoendopeptidase F
LELLQEEQRLCTAYEQLRAAQTVVWEGQTVSLPSLSAFLEQADRGLRQRAWRLISERQRADREALDTLWTKALQVRQQLARNAGYDSYRDYRWQQLFRFDYTPVECLAFHAAVSHVLVPETHPLWEKRRTLLGVDTLRPWDTEVDPGGNTSPLLSSHGRTREQQCATLFGCIDPQLASYVETMIQEQLLDLDARPGKATMNCTFHLPARRRPFLFATLKGSVRDGSAALSSPTQRGFPSPRIRRGGLNQYGTHRAYALAPGRVVQPEAASATLHTTTGENRHALASGQCSNRCVSTLGLWPPPAGSEPARL